MRRKLGLMPVPAEGLIYKAREAYVMVAGVSTGSWNLKQAQGLSRRGRMDS